MAQKTTAVNRELDRSYYLAHPKSTRATPIQVSQLYDTDARFPTYQGKAAETRHLIGYCRILAHRHRFGDRRPGWPRRNPVQFAAGHPLYRQEHIYLPLLTTCFDALAAFHASCVAPVFDPVLCRDSMRTFLVSNAQIHDLWRAGRPADEARVAPFHIRPKHHMLMHLVEDQIQYFGNPASCWCYADEDFCGVWEKGLCQYARPAD